MVDFDPPIYAYDQDKGINASLEYSILQGKLILLITTIPQYLQLYSLGIIQFLHYTNIGNAQRYFSIDPTTGKLYVTKEIDREALPITNGDIYNLQVEAKQKDNPLKATIANVSFIKHYL